MLDVVSVSRDKVDMVRLNLTQLNISQSDSTFQGLAKIPAMQRRRLSFIAKLALNNAIESLENNNVDYIVWVSQYGDEHKTFKILEDVLNDETPSPTQFSTSVHNAIAGLYSILCEDATLSTSLAGTWADAVIEAYSWLKTTHQANAKVLIVYYDEPLPNVYNEQQNFEALSLSAIFSLDDHNISLNLSERELVHCAALEAQDFYNFWQNASEMKLFAWQKY